MTNTAEPPKRKQRVYKKLTTAERSLQFFTEKQTLKNALRELVLKKGYTLQDAAYKMNIDDGRAEGLVFAKKPTEKQIDYAFEVYNKGFPLEVACVAAGVSIKCFSKARRRAHLR